jgi:hypothetical protein
MPLYHFELGRAGENSPFCADATVRADTPELALARLRTLLPSSIAWQSPSKTQPGEVLNIYIDPSRITVADLDPEQSRLEVEDDPLDTLAPGLGHFIASRAEKLVRESVICTSYATDHEPIVGKTLRIESVVYRPVKGRFAEVELPILLVSDPATGETHKLHPDDVFVTNARASALLRDVREIFAEARRWTEGPFHLAEGDSEGRAIHREFFRRSLARNFPQHFADAA